MGTWMWTRDGRERGRVWDDHGPSYCIILQGFDCGSIVVIPVQDSRTPDNPIYEAQPCAILSQLGPVQEKGGSENCRSRTTLVI